LQRDAQDQFRDVDRLDEILESIDQELPDDIKSSLEPISHLDNHYATVVRRALRSQSSRPVLEQRRAKVKQFVKESQAQIQSNKELLTELQPTLELKIARKAALEAELKTLTAEIEANSVVWTSLGPLPRWVPGPTTRWAPGTTRLALHGT
jgi:chromosome segregation ATPase